MKTRTLDDIWNDNFGEHFPPKADLLKHEFPNKWTRFHSLPESKRYPDSEIEENIIIDRHNSILNSIFKNNETIYLIRTIWTNDKKRKIEPIDNCEFWKSWVEYSDGDHYILGHSYYLKTKWKYNVLNEFILNTAYDKESNLMAIGTRDSSLYHPYDGGCDIVINDIKMINQLNKTFSKFKSIHPLGL
jgi:hypothetical protein